MWQAKFCEKPPGNSATEHQGQEIQLHNFTLRARGQVYKIILQKKQMKILNPKPFALQGPVGEAVQQVHGGELHDVSQICKKVQAESQ